MSKSSAMPIMLLWLPKTKMNYTDYYSSSVQRQRLPGVQMKISAAKTKCIITSKTAVRCKLVVNNQILKIRWNLNKWASGSVISVYLNDTILIYRNWGLLLSLRLFTPGLDHVGASSGSLIASRRQNECIVDFSFGTYKDVSIFKKCPSFLVTCFSSFGSLLINIKCKIKRK